MRIQDIIEGKLYSYITQQSKDFFFFNYRDESTIWVTSFNVNNQSTIITYEEFWIRIRSFPNEVYSQGSLAIVEHKKLLIKYLFEKEFKKVGVNFK